MRDRRFTFVCTQDERRLLAGLSQKLARSQGDVLRLLIREATRELRVPVHERGAAAGDGPAREARRAVF